VFERATVLEYSTLFLESFLADSKDELITRTHYGELITVNLSLRTESLELPHIRVFVVNILPN
jgi:hypothetical protein